MSEVEVVESQALKVGEYTVILGLAGPGFIANTAGMFVAKSKGWKQIAFVRSIHLPPMMLLYEGEMHHSFRIYTDGGRLLLVVTENLIGAEGCYLLAHRLVDWLKEKGAKEVYCLDGLPFSGLPENVKTVGYGSKIDVQKLGITPVREGAVSGLNAAMIDECMGRGVPCATLLIPTNMLTSIDYGGSADAVDLLNRLFNLGADLAPLRKNDEAYKKARAQQGGGQNPFSRR